MALRVRVCEVADVVAGELRGFPVSGVTWPVMLTILDDAIIAFPGVCPHDDVSLVDYGVLKERGVVCRVHGYRFDLDTGRCEHMPSLGLRRYRVTVVGSEVWVDLL
ncbi:MAG: Rieske 2Fe-2S domain-containing protein [Deltaproteobacteria bacterium]|nr:Rieske 2Fe-2S domain-containing protein [Deltaproteobacteria bacterium]